MARNLQAKLPSTDTIRVYDINTESVDRFANDTKALSTGASVQVAATAREAAEDSVCAATFIHLRFRSSEFESQYIYV